VIGPAGPAAARIDELFQAMGALGATVFVLFCLALAYAVARRRLPSTPPTPERDRGAARAIVLLGAVVPTLILVPLFVWTIRTLAALDPRARPPDLVVEVIGRQWWWQLRYHDPDAAGGFVTANELYVPVGRRVELRLTSSDVIHSFWVPALQGKTDLIPGRENIAWIEASRPGTYGGQCAEYCGIQHARMGLLVVAVPPDDYERWAARQHRPAAEPPDSLGRLDREAFLGSGCVLCHTVRGTPAGGFLGPDLTHVASRRTLAAGTLPNTEAHLAGWIADPQSLKPGARMPRVPLAPEQFHRIRRYLMTLE
jgi:cytochrome c oxidase subunit 2